VIRPLNAKLTSAFRRMMKITDIARLAITTKRLTQPPPRKALMKHARTMAKKMPKLRHAT
jgi:hypothetical protein